MKCPNCQFENRDDAKFCKACGSKLEGINVKPEPAVNAASVCQNCGAALKPGAKFCSKCGSAAAASPAPVPVPEPKTEVLTPEPKTEVLTPMPETEDLTEILMPKPEPAPIPAPESHTCPHCGAVLKPGAKFCSKCGSPTSPSAEKSAPVPQPAPAPVPQPVPAPAPAPVPQPAPAPIPQPVPAPEKPVKKKKKKPLIIVLCILAVLLLLGGGFFALSKAGLLPELPSFKKAENSEKGDSGKNKKTEDSNENADEENTEEDLTVLLEEELAPIAGQISDAEDKMDSEDYAGASADLEGALNAYADLVSEYDSQDVTDTVAPLAETAFDLYTKSILKQVEGWESQPPTAPLYQQIDLTMNASFKFADQLKESGLTVATDALETDYAEFPGRYKEKYILAFNDLVTGEQWSRTTAWMYMQDAASVGLVDRSNPDDPLTLRYAYSLAWITQKETSEGRADGSVTDEEAITSILAVAENADYNPVLMRELALCYDAVGDTDRSDLIKDACIDVCNYLANNEAVYINAEDLFVSGRNSSASSTIALNSFWYFNDFGEYSASITNGLRTEGREYIRTRYQEALNSLASTDGGN